MRSPFNNHPHCRLQQNTAIPMPFAEAPTNHLMSGQGPNHQHNDGHTMCPCMTCPTLHTLRNRNAPISSLGMEPLQRSEASVSPSPSKGTGDVTPSPYADVAISILQS